MSTFQRYFLRIICAMLFCSARPAEAADTLRLYTFDVDATPPPGTWLVYDKMINSWDQGLRAKGIVLTGSGQPIVLCVIDWIGVANEGYDEFCAALAEAAGTTPERVALHALHQHDAPVCDFGAERWLTKEGMATLGFEGTFAREVIRRLREAVKDGARRAKPVTHIGMGKAEVYKVASNRRIVDNNKVVASRTSATRDSAVRNRPEGLIDPEVSLISFWQNDQPLAVLSYYATHPQSYYRTGVANPDIPGVARFFRQLAVPDALHMHFNGAGGNITVGKYNDGSHENRLILAERLADGMQRAWRNTRKQPLSARDLQWSFVPVALPPKPSLSGLGELLHKETSTFVANNASKIVWYERARSGKKINVSCLRIGAARLVHLPGECFIEYQLAAKAMRPDLFVTVAAYGDYAPGYIGTASAYAEGGYETGQASAVTEGAEKVLLDAMRTLLDKR
ncbi:hypothetical protein ACWKWU_00880 [Chitinophaga lutea]